MLYISKGNAPVDVQHKVSEIKSSAEWKAIEEGNDVVSHKTLVQRVSKRKRVADTDIGKKLKEEIKDLEALLKAYREGVIEENL